MRIIPVCLAAILLLVPLTSCDSDVVGQYGGEIDKYTKQLEDSYDKLQTVVSEVESYVD